MGKSLVAEADFEERVRAGFGHQRFMSSIGATLERVSPGAVTIRLPFRDDLTQQHGFVHAGAIGAVADSACGYSAYSLMPSDSGVLTVEYKLNLLAPARGVMFLARGEVLRAGRTLTVCRADVIALESDDTSEGPVVATMLATIMALRDRPGVEG